MVSRGRYRKWFLDNKGKLIYKQWNVYLNTVEQDLSYHLDNLGSEDVLEIMYMHGSFLKHVHKLLATRKKELTLVLSLPEKRAYFYQKDNKLAHSSFVAIRRNQNAWNDCCTNSFSF